MKDGFRHDDDGAMKMTLPTGQSSVELHRLCYLRTTPLLASLPAAAIVIVIVIRKGEEVVC